MFVIQHMKLTW